MTMIDTSKGFEPSESVPMRSSNRKQSFTEKAGQSAFEMALSKSQEDDERWEAGLNASAQSPLSQAEGMPAPQDSRDTAGTTGAHEVSTTARESNAIEEASAPAPEEHESAIEETATSSEGADVDGEPMLEAASVDEGQIAVSEEDGALADAGPSEDSAADSVASNEPSQELAGDGGEPSDESTQEDLQAEASPEFDTEADISFDVNSAPDGSLASEPSSSSAPTPPAAGTTPQTFVESFGRQAFARSTQLHRAQTAAPASLDMNELVEQIAKVRGSMSTGRARVVIGEGSDRLALTVHLRNGTVNIDAKVADAGMAQTLERGAAELSEALGKHGLSLGTMDTGGSRGETFAQNDEPAISGPVGVEETVLESTSQHQRIRRGVRVVA
jgi:hypothetical protein